MTHAERIITVELPGSWKKTMRFTPATDEQFVIKEVLIDECYSFSFNKEDIVLNLGGNIGAFDVFAFDRVKQIITYEPDEEAFNKLLAHLRMNGIENVIANNCAVSDRDGFVSFTDGKDKGHNGIDDYGTRQVGCIDINKVCQEWKPNKIKCDIEGHEYVIFEKFAHFDSIDEIWMETHTYNDKMMKEHNKLRLLLRKKGFEVDEIRNDENDKTFILHAYKI